MTCPVPEEQQPLNEYLAIKDAFLYCWATRSGWPLYRILLGVWLGCWVVAGPVAASSFSPSRHLVEFVCLGSIGATIGLSLPLLRIWLAWIYVKNRLQSDKVLYEETGWYDGQEWQKPETDLAKDRLLVTYEVQPILAKIRNIHLGMAIAVISFILVLRVVS
ncbi:protein of unknown function DUF1230 [Thalassoporum mexicanum PCC 7367]|uniref:CGLD27 family protein n=1 Tax=Thalassoporum mexicanum TaxID=3457544 RepID=UPI00029FC76E|nr:CGLD27 family protein [Pseudanabaena sp. PCC 7367]AFY71235.1 protein of unknown function DUF1230 [Pseudanabaena sp. PCC 7367]